MDSRSRLDYALFQLTPTRTRCDLVICAGDCKEKLASGLLEPFISHLKFAKDEISKGGYSITLSAPDSASWFTKSTLERFVRFVSTPDVLERFITIEKEIRNIDGSMNSNALSDSQTIYSLDEHINKHEDITSDSLHEDDPKFHLQRALETRKAVLQREQAMVYARALVAGFETEFLQDLICFADHFGSPRLREACLNFIELCNTKSNDRVWMDEVAAMQAYSRSQYSYTEDDLGRELRINVPNANLEHFAVKRQIDSADVISDGTHLAQYMHPYPGGQGHMFQLPYQGYPFPYYQGNLPRPPSVEDSRTRRKRSRKKRSKELSQNASFDSSDSSSGSDSSSYRSSSRKVIIKNVNYINPARDEGSENGSEVIFQNLDSDRRAEEKQQWNIFQNLLLKDVDDNDSKECVSHKCEDPDIISPEVTNVSPVNGKHDENDWYMRSIPDTEIHEKSRDIFEDDSKMMESTKDVIVEYPLIVQARSLNEYSNSRLNTHDSLMAAESNVTTKRGEAACVDEPNDLHMVLERDSVGQQARPAWTLEMESGNSNCKIVEMDSSEVNKSMTKDFLEKGLEKKSSSIESKSKALAGSRIKKPTPPKTTILKGRSEKEEEKRKKMEELLTQRQKRIAERSASTVKTAKISKPKAQPPTKNDKPKAQPPTKNDKPKAQQTAKKDKPKAQQTAENNKPKVQQTAKNNKLKAQQQTTNKKVIRSSTIDRLSAARVVNPKVLPAESKPANKPTKRPTKKNDNPKPVAKAAKITTKAAGVENRKKKPDNVKPLDKNIVSNNPNGPKKKTVDRNSNKQLPKASQNTGNNLDHINNVSETLHKASLVLQKEITVSDSNGGSNNKATQSVSFKINEDFNVAKKKPTAKVNHEVPVTEILTPLPENASAERSNIKKKSWRSLETSSKAFSGFKKLLSFGRRS